MPRHRFIADRMLGRLARMLRLLGYDTLYQPELQPAGLEDLAGREDRIILTRGDTHLRFSGATEAFSIRSEYPPEQLCEIANEFSLHPKLGLWSRWHTLQRRHLVGYAGLNAKCAWSSARIFHRLFILPSRPRSLYILVGVAAIRLATLLQHAVESGRGRVPATDCKLVEFPASSLRNFDEGCGKSAAYRYT